MEIKNLKPNTKVKLHTKTGDFECVILESPNPEIILVKLNSGYNIGIREEDILDDASSASTAGQLVFFTRKSVCNEMNLVPLSSFISTTCRFFSCIFSNTSESGIFPEIITGFFLITAFSSSPLKLSFIKTNSFSCIAPK